MNPRLSFCTALYNRTSIFREVFAPNARWVQADPGLEWCIYDWGSTDGLFEMMQAELPRLTRRIVYARCRTVSPWHVSQAKNAAHLMASGEILMNLDGDNFIAGRTANLICGYIPKKADVLHLCSNRDDHRGTCGRIALSRDVFTALGCYDESLPRAGCQDVDLLARARHIGYRVVWTGREGGTAVQHDDEVRLKHITSDPQTSMWDFYRVGRELSAANISAGRLVANEPGVAAWWKNHLCVHCTFYCGAVDC